MTAMLILNAIGMTLIATAIVSLLAWAIVTHNRPALRLSWPRHRRARRALSGAVGQRRPVGLLD